MTAEKVKADRAIHLKVIGGSKTMDMEGIIFNYGVKRGPRFKKLPYPLCVGQRRMSPKMDKKGMSFLFFDIILIRSSHF